MANDVVSADLVPVDSVPVDLVPIREISRVTGINTVTLRAWERRYGLLVPQRTNKGHRLYSRNDIARVQEIQLWLGRGLAIGKVKSLLSNTSPTDNVLPEIDSVWQSLAQQFQQAISAFRRHALMKMIEESFALYPAEMLADYVLPSVLSIFEGHEPGKAAQRAFFTSVMQEYLLAAQNRLRKSAQGEKIVLVSSGSNENPLLPQILSYQLLVNQYQSEFLGYLDGQDLQVCVEALNAKILVIIGYETLNASGLKLHLDVWQEKSVVPVVITGNLAQIVSALGVGINTGIYPCEQQQQALATINQLLEADKKDAQLV